MSTDLLWSSLGPVVLVLFTDKHTLLGPVDQHVEGHEGDDAGQAEAAGVDLHAHLRPSTQVMTVEALWPLDLPQLSNSGSRGCSKLTR